VEEVVQARRRSHPAQGTVPRWRCAPTPVGFVLEVEERWTDADADADADADDYWYCRELFRADVTAGAISDLSVYCTGDRDSAQQERHSREAALVRP
jgi:hypothetical protein